MQLPYFGKSQNTKNDKFRCKQHIVLCMNSVVLNAEASSAVIRSLGVGATGRTFSPHGPLHYPIFLPTLLPFPLLHFPRLHPSLWPLPSTFSPICGKFWIYILQILAGEFWRVLNKKVASVIHLHSGGQAYYVMLHCVIPAQNLTPVLKVESADSLEIQQ